MSEETTQTTTAWVKYDPKTGEFLCGTSKVLRPGPFEKARIFQSIGPAKNAGFPGMVIVPVTITIDTKELFTHRLKGK